MLESNIDTNEWQVIIPSNQEYLKISKENRDLYKKELMPLLLKQLHGLGGDSDDEDSSSSNLKLKYILIIKRGI